MALTGLAIATSVAWKWQGIWPSTFLDFGATILLGTLLYMAQRSLVQVVRRENRRTRTAVENVGVRADALEQRLERQSARIETLADEIEEARTQRYSAQDAGISAVTEEMTFQAVLDALLAAERSRATSHSFRVRASSDLHGMRLYFRALIAMDRATGGTPVISLTTWFVDIRQTIRDSWQIGEDVTTVMNRIAAKLEAANIDSSVATFDPTAVSRNLAASLDLASRSRRGALSSRLRGPLIEMIDDHWALTDAGLESLVDDTFVARDFFPNTAPQFQAPGTPTFSPPVAPPRVPEATWDKLIELARVTYLLQGTSSIR